MTGRNIVLAFAALSIAAAAAADHISGKWGSDGQTLDGDATVTGTASFRQRQSTYNARHRAGHLQLEELAH